jgi:ubiquinone biosynthesis protein
MSEQVGWRGLWQNIRNEAPQWSALLPQLPRLLHRALADRSSAGFQTAVFALLLSQQRHNRLLAWILAVLLVILILSLIRWFV